MRHRLFPLCEIEDGSVRKTEIGGRSVAVVRIGESVYALGDTCSHQEVSLSEGFVDADDLTIECGRHGASFDLLSGVPTCLPAVKPVPVYEASVVDGDIWLSTSDRSEGAS